VHHEVHWDLPTDLLAGGSVNDLNVAVAAARSREVHLDGAVSADREGNFLDTSDDDLRGSQRRAHDPDPDICDARRHLHGDGDRLARDLALG
jgi:hypothetical protein